DHDSQERPGGDSDCQNEVPTLKNDPKGEHPQSEPNERQTQKELHVEVRGRARNAEDEHGQHDRYHAEACESKLRQRPASLTSRWFCWQPPPFGHGDSESCNLAQVTSVRRHAAPLTGPAAKGHRLRPEALDRGRLDPDTIVDQFTPAYASRAVDRPNPAPDVLPIGEDRETVAHRVMITGVDAVMATVTRAPGGIVRIPPLRDPDHRRPRCNAVHPLECTEVILPIPATVPTRAAKAVGRKKHGLGSPLPLASRRDIDDQDLGVPGMRIAAHPWQETLRATPDAMWNIGGQVDESDTFRIPRLRREKIPAAQTRGSRAFIPVAAARTNDEEIGRAHV